MESPTLAKPKESALRAAFPVLSRKVHGKPLVYLDNAATTLKPAAVLDAMDHYYRHGTANIHRGIHTLAEEATAAYEGARDRVAAFVRASSRGEILFTRGTTESINLVAQAWGRGALKPGDEILLTGMEHHANLVPWQLLRDATGAVLREIPVTEAGELDLGALPGLLGERTKLVAFPWVSNALGTVNPAAELVRLVRQHCGGKILVDGAQAVSHFPVDVGALDIDFLAFSGHKLYGPTGIGVLWGRESLLEAMPPWQGGGDMIKTVTFESASWNELPHKFEAGTPAIAEAIGLGAAVAFVEETGWETIRERENELRRYAEPLLGAVPGLRLLGAAGERAPVFSFNLPGVHPSDIGALLDTEGIAIRTGTHCTMPLHARFGLSASARASFAFYNTRHEADLLLQGLDKVLRLTR
ncbi:MAG: cysteine desulfurase [Spirochaetes bacterium]|nr:cysteine desulfurase [Spirochaetota bacterium]